MKKIKLTNRYMNTYYVLVDFIWKKKYKILDTYSGAHVTNRTRVWFFVSLYNFKFVFFMFHGMSESRITSTHTKTHTHTYTGTDINIHLYKYMEKLAHTKSNET